MKFAWPLAKGVLDPLKLVIGYIFIFSLSWGMTLVIPPTPHGGALGSRSVPPNSLIPLKIAHFLDFLVILVPIYFSLYIGTLFSSILDRFWLDFRPFLAPVLLQNRGQIQIVFPLAFDTEFS